LNVGREVAHAARGSGDQHALALGQRAVVEQALPRTERGKGNRGALHVVERPRLAHEQFFRDGGELGRHPVAVERRQGIDRFAVDDARELVGGNRRQPVLRPLELVPGDRRCAHLYQRLAGRRPRRVHLLDHQRVDPLAMEPYRAHVVLPSELLS